MRVIRIGERYSIATGEVETYNLLPVKTYLVMHSEREGFYLTEHSNIVVQEQVYVNKGKQLQGAWLTEWIILRIWRRQRMENMSVHMAVIRKR